MRPQLARHMCSANFQKNPMVNVPCPEEMRSIELENYIRRGKIGGWRDSVSPEMVAKMNEWILEILKEIDLVFTEF